MFSSSNALNALTGDVRRSLVVSGVGMIGHWNRCWVFWTWPWQRGQLGDRFEAGSILCLYCVITGDFPALSCDNGGSLFTRECDF